MQTEKREDKFSGPRVEIKVDFSRNLKELNDSELNDVINVFRHYKAGRLAELRKNNPSFGMVDFENHKFEREKVFAAIKEALKGADVPVELMDVNYADALNIIDWYDKENKKQNDKKFKEKKFSSY
ncbi:MAG: hypothetical protein HYX21_02155 [Candidatus Yanofskybacteria bacterium]|nr:hypothetical protein [Candidatus Yanofskybacteria bacterium]